MKINVKNTEKLQAAIDAVQGPRVTARTITAKSVTRAIVEIEGKLAALLPKKAWAGLQFSVDPNAQSFPGAYKGSPQSTQFKLERGASAWFVVSVGRSHCNGPQNRITPDERHMIEARDALLAHVSASKTWSA